MRSRERKLSLGRETLVTLEAKQLAKVDGGNSPATFITCTCLSCANHTCTLAEG